MFILTEEWLFKYYGSTKPGQDEDTKNWLLKYGTNVPKESLDLWSKFKHISEYQVNTPNIVPLCLGAIGSTFISELVAHAWVNYLRVPMASRAYKDALKIINPSTILELGVGGDSAISTAIWLSYIESKNEPSLISIDINPLGMTYERYKDVYFWRFNQVDSVAALELLVADKHKFDMVFIDTIHSYEHTTNELCLAQKLTDYILMDDATFEGNPFDKKGGGVKKAIENWREGNPDWSAVFYADNTVCLLMNV